MILVMLSLAAGWFDQPRVDDALRQVALMAEHGARAPDVPVTAAPAGRAGAAMTNRADIIIGDAPAETLTLTGSFTNQGSIYVINDGVLLIRHCQFQLAGNIYVFNRAIVDVDSSTMSFLQEHIYHYGIMLGDSARYSACACTTRFAGYPFSLGAYGQASVSFDRIYNHDWTTAVVVGQATSDLTDIHTAGEWLIGEQATANFTRIDGLLTWFFFPSASTVDVSFPASDTVDAFHFDSTLANVDGIEYSVTIDSAANCYWATIPLAGSDATIRDSDLRVTGLMFNQNDTFALSGLVNGLHYPDYILPVADRSFHLINTSVQTWNLYPSDSTNVTVMNSIFGELCAYGASYAMIQNAFCDGSGGHLEAADNALLIAAFSSVSADIISKGRGVCIVAYCAMPMGVIWATGASVMACVNTSFPEDPIPSDTAIVFVAAITGPSSASTDDLVPVFGSAWIDPGPYHPYDFGEYSLSYRHAEDTIWVPVNGPQYIEVRRDTLGLWSTSGLSSGSYVLHLTICDDAGDSISCEKVVVLRETGTEEAGVPSLPTSLRISRVCARTFELASSKSAETVCIYDATGRRVWNALLTGTTTWRAPAAGVYFVRGAAGNGTLKLTAF